MHPKIGQLGGKLAANTMEMKHVSRITGKTDDERRHQESNKTRTKTSYAHIVRMKADRFTIKIMEAGNTTKKRWRPRKK